MRGPGVVNMDLSLFRSFKLTEKFDLQFRAEGFNLSNTPHFGNPSGNANSSRFGQVTSTDTGWALRSVTGVPLWPPSGLLVSFDQSSGRRQQCLRPFFLFGVAPRQPVRAACLLRRRQQHLRVLHRQQQRETAVLADDSDRVGGGKLVAQSRGWVRRFRFDRLILRR